jgi:NAD(P)-dependent dehydrogenase (short-subunit alcohol dehydrogenase family)
MFSIVVRPGPIKRVHRHFTGNSPRPAVTVARATATARAAGARPPHHHPHQPRLDRRPRQEGAGRGPHPHPRAGTADEMAGVTCFLASDDATYITGQTLYVAAA